MIRVYYEEYHCDYYRKDHEQDFFDLDDLKKWIFNQMQQDYSDKMRGPYVLSFPTPEKAEKIGAEGPWEIEFIPKAGGPRYWIHLIKQNERIMFTDGKITAGQRHWSKEVQEWLSQCHAQQFSPQFDFIE